MKTFPSLESEDDITAFETSLAGIMGISAGRVSANVNLFQDEVDWVSIMHPDLTADEA